LSDCVKECVWLRRLLKDMGSDQADPSVIYEANHGAMALAKNVGYQRARSTSTSATTSFTKRLQAESLS
jgi:hypothetical protein